VIPRLRPALAALTLCLALVGCSSNDASSTSPAAASGSAPSTASGTSAADYAKGLCTALTSWAQDVQTSGTSFDPSGTDLETIKQQWLDFLDGVIATTDSMLTEIQNLGTPDVPGAEDAINQLTTAFQGMRDSFQSLRDQSADLPTSNRSEFTTKFQTLVSDFQTNISNLGQAFSNISNDDLDKAFQDEPACSSVAGS
jgi:hypothetical protein